MRIALTARDPPVTRRDTVCVTRLVSARLILILATLILTGCSQSYETRMDRTIQNIKYNDRLDRNLKPPAQSAGLADNNIYLRPPQPMDLQSGFGLPGFPIDQFEAAAQYQAENANLYVLARYDAATRAAEQEQGAMIERGDFRESILSYLRNAYGNANVDVEIAASSLERVDYRSEIYNKSITYDQLVFLVSGFEIEIYIHEPSDKPDYHVALIFAMPEIDRPDYAEKIRLCLQELAVGSDAQQKFRGGLGPIDSGGGPAPQAF